MGVNWEEIERILGRELAEILREFCDWSGKKAEDLITEAIYERLLMDCQEIGSFGVPVAKEFAERLKELEEA